MIKLYSYMGSKARMLDLINKIIKAEDFRTYNYIEPFLGSGIVFLNIEKAFKSYFLNDLIPSLTLFFENYNKIDKKLLDELIKYEVSNFNIEKNKEGYYKFRDEVFNTETDVIKKTIYFFMLAN